MTILHVKGTLDQTLLHEGFPMQMGGPNPIGGGTNLFTVLYGTISFLKTV